MAKLAESDLLPGLVRQALQLGGRTAPEFGSGFVLPGDSRILHTIESKLIAALHLTRIHNASPVPSGQNESVTKFLDNHMRPGWNPTRRNRNIGTKAQGYGSNNKLTIPESWHQPKRFYENLNAFKVITRTIAERDFHFFIEPTKPDWFYPCTVDDICKVLSHCPPEALAAFDLIVMRQPTRKQRILSPVWGRAIFFFDINQYSGPAIVIEAQDLSPIGWGKSIDPELTRELERLRRDGHEVRNTRRGLEIRVTPTSLRNTALYRTLLHELGHHVDYQRSTEDEWDQKTRTEKEDYAHKYALEAYTLLAKQGVLPFDLIIDEQSLQSDDLNRDWFYLPEDDQAT
ncbi:hypothetical protein [Andreprevotia chitinilytica]|uniref:hypothetical protein n=1 Tax=Andreprevotia chitinilytica TaxID=396808 RepID=UPI000B22DA98|nr:hypothetical protein [Andreprevotia chitinilytica]